VALQTDPPPLLQSLFSGAAAWPHTFELQTATRHAPVGAGQSPATLHWTHVPEPLQTLSLPTLQAVPRLAFAVPHVSATQVVTLQVPGGLQTQSLQLPWPSHVSPVPHGVVDGEGEYEQEPPAVHVAS